MKKSKTLPTLTMFFFGITLSAQNPIVGPGMYIADPSAHTWHDGKMYVYGSRDENPNYYCSWNYHILASSDLKTWEVTENTFASKGPNDQVSYSDDILYAPDCQYRNGTYYLYYCLASNKNTEGVATGTLPTGPFINGKNINLKGINEIDPAVFIDDDGQTYYIWGQIQAKIARLKPGMTDIDTSTIKTNLLTEKEHYFHEGGYMVKRKGIYYFIYADMSRAGRPTCIGYATSKSPMGPFKYGGVIIDNDHCDPGCWNNHGSIAEFNGKWYVFYHRSTHGSNSMRKVCMEPITFNKDGSINEVEMTTQGAAQPLNPTSTIDAERACLLYGNVRVKAFSENNEALCHIKNGDAAGYKYFGFNENVDSVKLTFYPGKKGIAVDIGLDNVWGPSIAKFNLPDSGDGKTLQTLILPLKAIKGKHAVWLRFWGDGDDLLKIESFQFVKKQ